MNNILKVGDYVKINIIGKVDDVIVEGSQYPNGAIGCLATCYSKLVNQTDYIPAGELSKCNKNGSNADKDGIFVLGDYWKCDNIMDIKALDSESADYPRGIATLLLEDKAFRCDCGILKKVKVK